MVAQKKPKGGPPKSSSSSKHKKPKKDKKDKNHGDDGKVKKFPTSVKHEGEWVYFVGQCDRKAEKLYLDSNAQVSMWLGGDAGCICDHLSLRSLCMDCGGSCICEHGRRKERCKDCGGSQICEHGKRKDRCKDCGGNQNK